ncbi:hypothetical protein QVD17_21984 [Tagetes erecta]|uniref:Uncharacterized protein n=1 Tax=Tagetes erecta TaxID=13708 RepID=A0AAD8KCI7_TARER|nr:hypothetical protein QVD17_21984 [Tagetes erecta]
MATSKLISVCILLLLLIANVSGLETTSSYRGVRSMEKGVFNSRQFLNDLVLEFSKMNNYSERKLIDTNRVAPGGPDGQHH